MYDLHCHLLPGSDDGPQSLDEALEMARLAVAEGIRKSVVTPHLHVGRWENDRASIEAAVADYRRALESSGIGLEIGFAAEVRCDYDIVPYVEEGRVPFLGTFEGERVMLLEFPHGHVPLGGDKLVAWLRERGIRSMIAHPERNKDIMRDLAKLQPYVDSGCLLQLTADAIAGEFGPLCQTRAREILERGWATVMASDAHDTEVRPPRLKPGIEKAAQVIGERAARDLVETTPRRIVDGA